jgi:CRP-like cAMP-binding protein
VPASQEPLAATLAGFPLLSSLDPRQLDDLSHRCYRRQVAKGQFVFYRGDPCSGFYGVCRGMVQLSMSNAEGAQKVVEIIGANETFAEAALFLGNPYPVDAIALTACELVKVPAAVFDDMLAADARFARSLLASMAIRLHTRVSDIEMYTLRSASQRVAAFLVDELGGGTPPGQPAQVLLRPAKHVLASRLGLTPETFSRVIRSLADQGLIVVDGRRLTVPDPGALGELAT